MAVPKRRTSVSKRNKRRAHDSLTRPTLVPCQYCSALHVLHRACTTCGVYRGRKVAEPRE